MKPHLINSFLIASTITVLVAPPVWADVTQVTAIQVNSTPKGLEIILETPEGKFPQVFTSSYRQTFVANILNTQLALPQGKSFRRVNPSEGIASVSVTGQGANSIRVTVVGTSSLPKVAVGRSDASGGLRQRALTLTLTRALAKREGVIAPTAQQPQPTPQAPAAQPESLTEPESTAPQESDDLTQEPAQTEQPVDSAAGEEDIEIVVTGEQETGYSVPDATTATKTDTPLRDIPQSIQVIPRQVIEDRQVVRLNELAENVSGVQPQPGYGGLSSGGYTVRGFGLDFETFRNGFRDFGFISPRDVANVEQVEILKGPASVLYGGGFGFSGLVNTVTKKPQEEPLYNANFTIGSYDFYRPTIDITGPLSEDKALLYRLNLAYESAESFRDFNENESTFVAPALTWQIGPRTTLTTEFEDQKYDYVFDRGLLPSEEFFDVPISRFLGEPGVNDAEFESFSGTYNFEHEFSDNWKFRQGFNAINITGKEVSVTTSNFEAPFLEANGRTLPRQAARSDESAEN